MHRDDRFGIDAAGIIDECAGGRYGDLRHILLIPERLAAEIDGEGPVFVIAQDFGKLDLVRHAGMIKATRTSDQPQRSSTLEPRADFVDAAQIPNRTFHGKNEIVVYIVGFQRRERAAPGGDIRKRRPLGRTDHAGLRGDVDAVIRALDAVP